MATTASAPKRDVTVMLLTSTQPWAKWQVNSALVYPPAGTLFKLTVARVDSPRLIVCGLTVVDTNGPKSVGVADGDGKPPGVDVLVAVGKVPVGDGGVPGVVVTGTVGVGVGTVSRTFKSGLNKPSVVRPFEKVVILNRELYLTSQPANVAPTIDGRSMKCKCGTLIS